jgi:hypothetical protein
MYLDTKLDSALIILFPIITSKSFADSILIEFDKLEYPTG